MALFAVSFVCVLGWNAEFPGYMHFHNWDGALVELGRHYLPDGDAMPVEMAKDYCWADSSCHAFGWHATAFRDLNFNSSQDLYLANSTTGAPGAFCSIDTGGCMYPSIAWLHCGNDFFSDTSNIIGTFELPPDVLHTSCKSHPDCVGFRVDNGGAKGALLKKGFQGEGWFALPSSAKTVAIDKV